MSKWVNFKKLREALDFNQVLLDYGVEVSVKRDQATAFCPLPGHKERSKRKSKSFSVNLKRGIFQCFGCQAKGNVLDFAVLMDGRDPDDIESFRRSAVQLQTRYFGAATAAEKADRGKETVEEYSDGEEDLEHVVNAPLDFELKRLDAEHAYLRERGLTPETIAHFGLGYCSRGMMTGRVVIPLHDQTGQLIGYAGRLVDESAVSDENPKYKLPGNRRKDDVVHEFRKSAFVYNGHRLAGPLADLIVVEGFFGAMWLYQCGYANVVALMGSSCSERQGEVLVDLLLPDGRLWVMSDGDDAGEKCGLSVLAAVAPHRFVRWARLETGQQPDNLSMEALAAVLGNHLLA
ncbi:MAG: toprim domain-containing protein [Chloroflexi bacterium]|nr:toprim domain-containing protein [Chloroflexota bacterium]